MMKRSVKEKGIQNRIMEKVVLHDILVYNCKSLPSCLQEKELHHHRARAMRQSIEDLREGIGYDCALCCNTVSLYFYPCCSTVS